MNADAPVYQPTLSTTRETTPTKALLVLDIDETLLSSFVVTPNILVQLSKKLKYPYTLLTVEFGTGYETLFAVTKRPFMDQFLRYVARFYRLALWSAGSTSYVWAVIEQVLPRDVTFEFIFTRPQCVVSEAIVNGIKRCSNAKDLTRIFRYDAARTLLVDNNSLNAVFQLDNYVCVPDFDAQHPTPSTDDCLPELAEFLESIATEPDLTKIDKWDWLDDATVEDARTVLYSQTFAGTLSPAKLHQWRNTRQRGTASARKRQRRSTLAISLVCTEALLVEQT